MDHPAWITVGVSAGVILQQDEKFLLVQEGSPDIRGLWNCPAGHVDQGMTLEATAVKEAKEESGYDVELVRPLGIWHPTATDTVKHLYEAKIVGGVMMKPNEEIMDIRWCTIDEIRELRDHLRGPWVLEAIQMVARP
jgi:ADP-ribose pyrophosphatase YjhB (NUDIX family)